MVPSDNIRLKLDWATEHLKALHQALEVFYASKPCVAITNFDAKNQRDIIMLQVTKTPDLRLGLLASDFLYNLRSCLDYLFWQLALIESGGKIPIKPKRVEFPISDNADTNSDARRKLDSILGYIPQTARGIIKGLQPYMAGPTDSARKAHPLYILDTLCNVAKHRIIPVRAMMAEMDVPAIPGCTYKWLDNGAIEVSIPAPHPQLPPPRAGILFGEREEGETDVNIITLIKIYKFVAVTTLPKFRCFFPQDIWFQTFDFQKNPPPFIQ